MIAGRAPPGAQVTIQADGGNLAVVEADQLGEWLVILEDPLESGPQDLTLKSITPEGIVNKSNQILTVVVPENTEPDEVGAVAVLQNLNNNQPPRIIQGGIPDPGIRDRDLTLDAIQYDDEGNLILSGKALAGTEVRVFVDDIEVGQNPADNEGLWKLIPDRPLEVGRHQLRVELIGKEGNTVATVELPFMRAKNMSLMPGEVIVQPGTNLWRIARAQYGKGTMYSIIFMANAEQIDDPDLIFPGQIFMLPENPNNIRDD